MPCLALESGAQGIALFKNLISQRKPVFKVILLDYSMPELNGPETAIEILRLCREAGCEKPTIICVTAYQDESYESMTSDAGMEYFFTKPVSFD